MKTLITALSLLSFAAIADTNGVYNLPKQTVFGRVRIELKPAMANTNYTVTAKTTGGTKDTAVVGGIRTNGFTVFCSPGTTNLTWSLKAR